MGFSVSGATALLFIAFLIAFGTFYSATTGAVERVQEAEIETHEQNVETLNTDIEIRSANYSTSNNELTIVANNTGAEPLQPTSLSLLVDGTFTPISQSNISISDSPEDELWAPQQQLTLTLSSDVLPGNPSGGETVKLVTRNAIADTAQITEVS